MEFKGGLLWSDPGQLPAWSILDKLVQPLSRKAFTVKMRETVAKGLACGRCSIIAIIACPYAQTSGPWRRRCVYEREPASAVLD